MVVKVADEVRVVAAMVACWQAPFAGVEVRADLEKLGYSPFCCSTRKVSEFIFRHIVRPHQLDT